MDQNLKALYNTFKDAAYEAYYEANKPTKPAPDPDDTTGNLQKQSNSAYNDLEKKVKDSANIFADEFVKKLKNGKVLETISDEIDGHVKAIKLMISVPTLLPTIISPMGPCTGALTISQETGAQIQLL
jgi:hypothetical protein